MEPIQELKQTLDQLGTAVHEFRSEYDKLFAEVKGSNLRATIGVEVKDILAKAKLDNVQQQIDDLTGKRDDLEKRIKAEAAEREELERKLNLLRAQSGKPVDDKEEKARVEFNEHVKSHAIRLQRPIPNEFSIDEYRSYKNAVKSYLKKGEKMLTADETKAMQVGIDSDGGYLVYADLSGRIVTRLFDLSPIRAIANVQVIGSDALEGVEDLNEADAGWVGEVATRSETNTPGLGKYRIEANEMYAKPKASQKLLDDSSVDIESWLGMKVSDKFARLEGAAFVAGNTPTRPRGFTSYTTAATADASRAWGVLEHVKTGANGDFHTTQADPLFDLIAAFKPGYLNGANWVTRRSVMNKIRKFKTTTTLEYIWQPGLQMGQPDRLLGYPIVMAEDMPTLATGSNSMALGNFQLGYQIVDRLGIRVLRDPYTDKPFVQFYTIKRTGGAVVQFEAIKFINFAS